MNGWKLKTWKINRRKLQNWKRLDPNFPKEKATDCVINSLAFLGILEAFYPNKEVESFAKRQNIKSENIYLKDILKIIYDNVHLVRREKYEIGCVLDVISNNTIVLRNQCMFIPGFSNNLHSRINNGEFTLLNLHRGVGVSGHTVVLGKMDDNLYIIDPQQETINKELEKMDIDNNNCIDVRSISSLFENYLSNENVINVSYIVTRETDKRISEDSPFIRIRKSKPQERPLKKPKRSGGKKKSGKKKLKHTRKYKKKSRKKKKGKKKKTIKKHKKKSGKKKH